jgi:hypothetical protein
MLQVFPFLFLYFADVKPSVLRRAVVPLPSTSRRLPIRQSPGPADTGRNENPRWRQGGR